MRALVEAGADVNAESRTLRTLGASSPLVAAVRSHDLAVVRYLVEHGAKTNEPCAFEWPLLAAVKSNKEIVEYLLAQGADVNATNGYSTALMEVPGVSAAQNEKRLEIMRVLIAAGAKVNFVTEDCRTALSGAQQTSNTATEQLLRQHGADASLAERCRQERAQLKEKAAGRGPRGRDHPCR